MSDGNPDVIVPGDDTRELFSVHIADDGYFAIREAEPAFCLHGASIAEAAAKAERAFDSWKRLSTKRQ